MSSASGSRRAAGEARRTPPLVVLAAVLAMVVLVGAGGFFLLRGGGDADSAGPRSSGATTTDDTGTGATTTPSAPPTPTEPPDPLDDPLSPQSLDKRYRGLAKAVTTGFEGCRRAKAREGQRERVMCEARVGTLELVTYRKQRHVDARRDKAITYAAGGVLDVREAGVLMAHEEENDRDVAASAFLYWDDTSARQSATYFAGRGTDLDGLVALFTATTPKRTYPAGLGSPQLVDFIDQWLDPTICTRIETVNDGALEESYCDVRGPIEVYVGRFRDEATLVSYRQMVLASAIADGREVRDWNQAEGDPPVGALYEFTTDSGAAVRYWDEPGCVCYAEAYLRDGTYEQVQEWWLGG